MADQAINALSTKTAPETSDQLLLVGTGEPQLIDYDKLADAILNKITSKNYALDAGQMTLLAAINKLNSETKKMILLPNGKTVTLVSTQDYDTIIIVGQLGGKIFFDIISLHQNAHIIHLGEITIAVNSTTKTSTIIEIPNYAICIALGSGQLSYL